MSKFNTDTIRTNIDAFRHFASDRSGKPTSENAWPNRLIYFYLKQNRAYVIHNRDLSIVYDFSDDQLDNLGCVELVKADMVECPCAPKSGCMFLKSKYPVPKMIDGQMLSVKLLLGGDYGVLGSWEKRRSNIDYVPWFKFDNKINSRIKAQAENTYYTIKKDKNGEYYLYVYNKERLKAVDVSGIFSDPVDVAIFPSCGEEPNFKKLCTILDLPFPIKEELKGEVFSMTFQQLIGIRNSSPEGDEINDDIDNTSVSPKQTK